MRWCKHQYDPCQIELAYICGPWYIWWFVICDRWSVISCMICSKLRLSLQARLHYFLPDHCRYDFFVQWTSCHFKTDEKFHLTWLRKCSVLHVKFHLRIFLLVLLYFQFLKKRFLKKILIRNPRLYPYHCFVQKMFLKKICYITWKVKSCSSQ